MFYSVSPLCKVKFVNRFQARQSKSPNSGHVLIIKKITIHGFYTFRYKSQKGPLAYYTKFKLPGKILRYYELRKPG